jgi:hypothetical protein
VHSLYSRIIYPGGYSVSISRRDKRECPRLSLPLAL